MCPYGNLTVCRCACAVGPRRARRGAVLYTHSRRRVPGRRVPAARARLAWGRDTAAPARVERDAAGGAPRGRPRRVARRTPALALAWGRRPASRPAARTRAPAAHGIGIPHRNGRCSRRRRRRGICIRFPSGGGQRAVERVRPLCSPAAARCRLAPRRQLLMPSGLASQRSLRCWIALLLQRVGTRIDGFSPVASGHRCPETVSPR